MMTKQQEVARVAQMAAVCPVCGYGPDTAQRVARHLAEDFCEPLAGFSSQPLVPYTGPDGQR